MHEDFAREQRVEGSSNRAFGLVFVIVFLVIALWPLFIGAEPRWWSLVVSGLLAIVTLAAPSLLTTPNRLWLRFGSLLHRLVSPVVLAVMFYLVVTPTGLIMRLFSKNVLNYRFESTAETYWIRRDPPGPPPDSMRNQF